jgi:hypothetical protein
MRVAYGFILSSILGVVGLRVQAQAPEPIIDMHLHAKQADELGPPPLYLCAPFSSWPVKDAKEAPETYYIRVQNKPACPAPLRSGANDDDLMSRTLEVLRSNNVTLAVTDGDLGLLEKWEKAAQGRILPALPFDPESGKPTVNELRELVKRSASWLSPKSVHSMRGSRSLTRGWSHTFPSQKSLTYLLVSIWDRARLEPLTSSHPITE